MRIPQTLVQWREDGLIDEVVRPLKSGKEADVFLVMYRSELCAAKVYKEREGRSFKNRSPYVEGRKVRNSRLQRAMSRGSRFGRDSEEAAWKSAEMDALVALHASGVRVPEPLIFSDGILVMRLVMNAYGEPAPRLSDLDFLPQEALHLHRELTGFIADMLALGYIHGDFSPFNVLMAAEGPTVIDLPQVVLAAHNSQARQLLLRDVQSISQGLARFNPEISESPEWGEALWRLYETGKLKRGMTVVPVVRSGDQPRVDLGGLRRELHAVEKERGEFSRVPQRPDPLRGVVPPRIG